MPILIVPPLATAEPDDAVVAAGTVPLRGLVAGWVAAAVVGAGVVAADAVVAAAVVGLAVVAVAALPPQPTRTKAHKSIRLRGTKQRRISSSSTTGHSRGQHAGRSSGVTASIDDPRNGRQPDCAWMVRSGH